MRKSRALQSLSLSVLLLLISIASPSPAQTATPAAMIAPVLGTTFAGSSVPFSWSAGVGASEYWLWIGSAPGGLDLYDASQGLNTTVTITRLPTNGQTIYVRLFSWINAAWQFNDYVFTAARIPPAVMISPLLSTTPLGASATFAWTTNAGVMEYWLWIGSTPGTADLYDANQGANSSVTVTGLPNDGRTLYVRLWSDINNAWQFNDYVYGPPASPAQMTSPVPSTTALGSSVSFSWTRGTGASEYWLWIGSAPAGADVYDASPGTNTSVTVTGLPNDGRTLYVRLFSYIFGSWRFNDYVYGPPASPAQMTSPAPSTAVLGSSVTFSWMAGRNATGYWLWIGSTLGARDLYDANQGASLTVTASGLPNDGRTLYVRLLSYIFGSWQFNDYVYGPPASPAQMISPASGATVLGSSITFNWTTGRQVSEYWLWIGTTAGGRDLYDVNQGANTGVAVSGLPGDGSTLYVRLWSYIFGGWQFNDYTCRLLPAVPAGSVSGTNHPQVADYTMISPRAGNVTIQLGTTTSYGLNTWSQALPANGGRVDILVAGMLPFTVYHMRAVVNFTDGTVFQDQDHSFTTGGLTPDRIPTLNVTTPAAPALVPNRGIELVNLLVPANNQITLVALDLSGNIIWYYDYPQSEGFTDPIKPLPNGHFLLQIGGNTVREIDLAGNTVNEFTLTDLNDRLAAAGFSLVVHSMHHDLLPLPNGHLLLLVNSIKPFFNLLGYPGETDVLGDGLVDLDANYNPVWTWNAFDYLDVNRHPFNWPLPDWMHSNALVYVPDDGNVLLSVRHQNWILKIDYRNGRGTGAVLWRLGYQGDFTLTNGGPADWFYAQHAPSITSANSLNPSLAVFDNGDYRVLDIYGTQCDNGCYSRAAIFQLDETAKTALLTWQYLPGAYSAALGSFQVLANNDVEFDLGDLSVNPKTARLLEVTHDAAPQIVWQVNETSELIYRAYRLPSLYPGVQW